VDALAYLEKSGVEGEPLREALAGYAAVGAGEVHPYFLGLCADVALAAQRRGDRLDPASFGQSGELAGKQLDLARRLLAWVPAEVEYAILALSACRSFTYRTFGYLGGRLEFGTSAATSTGWSRSPSSRPPPAAQTIVKGPRRRTRCTSCCAGRWAAPGRQRSPCSPGAGGALPRAGLRW
jgi:hypothetical protein